MRRFLLARQLPAIFALCVAGVYVSLGNDHPLVTLWCLCAAIWIALIWLILARN